MDLRDYSTLRIDINSSKGTGLVLLFCVSVTFNNEQNSYPKMSVKRPLAERYFLLLPINATSGHL